MFSPIAAIKSRLTHPLTRGLHIDSPRTTELRRQIVLNKPFLRRIYEEWYQLLAEAVPAAPGQVLEIGGGGGFLQRYIPDLITSDVFPCEGIDRQVDAHSLPFENASLRAVLFTDVLHHLHDVRRFFHSAARCVRPGGVIAMIEPWVSNWSNFVYRRLHHEPLQVDAAKWEFPPSGPLSGANIALPWIVFERDRSGFATEFPQWEISRIKPMMPFRYLVSGGVSMRSLAPSFSYPLFRTVENLLSPWMKKWAMFAFILLTRTEVSAEETSCRQRRSLSC